MSRCRPRKWVTWAWYVFTGTFLSALEVLFAVWVSFYNFFDFRLTTAYPVRPIVTSLALLGLWLWYSFMSLVCTSVTLLECCVDVLKSKHSGVPILYWYLLFSSRLDIKSRFVVKDKKEKERINKRLIPISFLFVSFKPEYWYWELVDTCQRLL